MVLELRLVKDGKILFKVPMEGSIAVSGLYASQMDDKDIERLVGLHSLAANEKRVRIMLEMMKKGEMSFTELLGTAVNPKLVKDCMEPMMREGMVIHEGRGSGYRPSEAGVALAMTMTAGLSKLLDYLEREVEEDLE